MVDQPKVVKVNYGLSSNVKVILHFNQPSSGRLDPSGDLVVEVLVEVVVVLRLNSFTPTI